MWDRDGWRGHSSDSETGQGENFSRTPMFSFGFPVTTARGDRTNRTEHHSEFNGADTCLTLHHPLSLLSHLILSVLLSCCLFSQLDRPHLPYNVTHENHEYTENPRDKITAHVGTTPNPENWPIQLNPFALWKEFQLCLVWGTELGYIYRGLHLQTRY